MLMNQAFVFFEAITVYFLFLGMIHLDRHAVRLSRSWQSSLRMCHQALYLWNLLAQPKRYSWKTMTCYRI